VQLCDVHILPMPEVRDEIRVFIFWFFCCCLVLFWVAGVQVLLLGTSWHRLRWVSYRFIRQGLSLLCVEKIGQGNCVGGVR
jgi:hypothetical protein